MFKNYLRQTWRSLTKHKTYSILNIIGLTAGLTCFAFITLWVNDELNFDKFNSNYDRIVRLVSTTRTETGIVESAVSSAPMAKALKDDYPEVENTVRLDLHEEIVEYKNQQVLQPGILLTDPSFFEIFSFKLSRGNVATALNEPYTIILTQSTAKKYFGDADPMGKMLVIFLKDSTGHGAAYKITGLMPDPPADAHFTFSMLVSFKTAEIANPDILTTDGWGDASFYTYMLLKKNVDYKTFSDKITHFYGKYIGDQFKIWKPIYSYKLQPLSNIHLRSNLQSEIAPVGNITQVYIFFTIGIFILLLAGINYTNLATARAAGRAKETAVKKVAGADKKQLIAQYLSESVITAFIALLLSLTTCFLLQPVFDQLTGKELSLLSSPLLLLFLLGVTTFIGIISGIYPAIVLSAFKPAIVLKGSFKSSDKGILLRKTLVVSQFIITIILVTGIIIIHAQMSFIQHKDLGYNKDALIYLAVNGNADVIKGYSSFKDDLLRNPKISGITTSNSLIVGGLSSGGAETIDNKENPLQVNTSRLRVDENYMDVYGIRLMAGKNFTGNSANDTTNQIILNEMAVKRFGWKTPEAAIGRPFKMGDQQGRIIAVTNNFHYGSLQQAIEPLAIYPVRNHFSRITLKVDMTQPKQVISFIQDTWKKHFSAALFDYDFVSNQVKRQYESEDRFTTIFFYFSVLSLMIACLGLYGLISFTIFQKTKEIGIRKVLGATANSIAAMLSAGFLKLVLLACFIAIPVTWYMMNKWLDNFAYRVNISWWNFSAAGLIVVFIALITVSFQSIKAALANPVQSLRTE